LGAAGAAGALALGAGRWALGAGRAARRADAQGSARVCGCKATRERAARWVGARRGGRAGVGARQGSRWSGGEACGRRVWAALRHCATTSDVGRCWAATGDVRRRWGATVGLLVCRRAAAWRSRGLGGLWSGAVQGLCGQGLCGRGVRAARAGWLGGGSMVWLGLLG